MLRRIRSRVSSAHVIATIALFVALGGGYATAFSGSGKLQKASVPNIGTSFQDVRSLDGFGVLRARCDPNDEFDPNDDEVEYQLRNTSDKLITYQASRGGVEGTHGDFIFEGSLHTIPIASRASFPWGTMTIHVSKPGKAQVLIVASNQGSCGLNRVLHVLALNTVG